MNAFVYGTLRRGEINDIENLARRLGLAAPRWLGLGRVPGRLVDFGGWPGLIDGPGAGVLGEAYGIDAALLAAMDEVEEYVPGQDTLFVRRATEVVIGGRAVPCHYYPIEPRLMGDARPIAGDDWVAYRLARG